MPYYIVYLILSIHICIAYVSLKMAVVPTSHWRWMSHHPFHLRWSWHPQHTWGEGGIPNSPKGWCHPHLTRNEGAVCSIWSHGYTIEDMAKWSWHLHPAEGGCGIPISLKLTLLSQLTQGGCGTPSHLSWRWYPQITSGWCGGIPISVQLRARHSIVYFSNRYRMYTIH